MKWCVTGKIPVIKPTAISNPVQPAVKYYSRNDHQGLFAVFLSHGIFRQWLLNPICTFLQTIRLSYFIKCHLSSFDTRKRKPFSICKNLIHQFSCPDFSVMTCIAENSICLYVPWMCSYFLKDFSALFFCLLHRECPPHCKDLSTNVLFCSRLFFHISLQDS